MDLSHIILGPLVTEKTERLKRKRTYGIRVAGGVTKIDIKRALHTLYDVEVQHVRALWVQRKWRSLSGGRRMEKRQRVRKALVTLTPKSKPLDLTSFKKQ